MNWTEAMVKAADLTERHGIRARVYGWHTRQGWTYCVSWAFGRPRS